MPTRLEPVQWLPGRASLRYYSYWAYMIWFQLNIARVDWNQTSGNNAILCCDVSIWPRWPFQFDLNSDNIYITSMWYFAYSIDFLTSFDQSIPVTCLALYTCLCHRVCASRLSRGLHCTLLIAFSSALNSLTSPSNHWSSLSFFLLHFNCISWVVLS